MAYTINLNDDCISAEELQLMQTKQAILEKLHVHFGDYAARNDWEAADGSAVKELQAKAHPRG